ncbi:FAD synthetase family protein [Bacillus sp. FJAT-45350]|uniref:FAD synthetase family protein n=1 Tax=Bacillus sp. FJAT-45350 TaxID=2011014 RepID=UPI000BB8661E|nr:FAD synthetase family protein [Bacillus sp. FJAT-45350]
MRVINFSCPEELKVRYFPSTVLAIGFFDSVHLGHQHVIKTAKEISKKKGLKLAALTFFPHPKEVLSNGTKKVNYLTPLSDKIQSLANLGVEICYLVNFNKEFSNMSPKKFVHECIVKHNVKHVVAGFDFAYGRRGEGNMSRMKEDGNGMFDVTTISKVEEQNNKISSTLIRNLINDGEVDKVPSYLGDFYISKGNIEGYEMDYRQNKIYFTLKQHSHYMLPKSGAYKVELTVDSRKIFGIAYVDRGCSLITLALDQSINNLDDASVTIKWINHSEEHTLSSLLQKARIV